MFSFIVLFYLHLKSFFSAVVLKSFLDSEAQKSVSGVSSVVEYHLDM